MQNKDLWILGGLLLMSYFAVKVINANNESDRARFLSDEHAVGMIESALISL